MPIGFICFTSLNVIHRTYTPHLSGKEPTVWVVMVVLVTFQRFALEHSCTNQVQININASNMDGCFTILLHGLSMNHFIRKFITSEWGFNLGHRGGGGGGRRLIGVIHTWFHCTQTCSSVGYAARLVWGIWRQWCLKKSQAPHTKRIVA